MKRLIPILTVLAALAIPAIASAHTAAITVTCPTPTNSGVAHFTYQNFPWGQQVVDRFLTVDTITVAGSGKFGFQGPNGSGDMTFTIPADGQSHRIDALTRWTQDTGGQSVQIADCSLPAPPAPPVVPPTPTPPNPSSECHLGTVCCPVCVTSRERTILAGAVRISRRTAATTKYVNVRSGTFTFIAPRADVMAANLRRFGVAFDPVGRRVTVPLKRNSKGRLSVRISQKGLLAVRGQYFNGTLSLVDVNGKRHTERRNWRLCMINDGELDVPSNRLRD